MKKIRFTVALIMMFAFVSGYVISIYAASDKVNINTATQEELMQLEGIGSAYAQKIIEYREANGPFQKPEDIMNVKGVGEATFEKNKDRITVVKAGEDESK